MLVHKEVSHPSFMEKLTLATFEGQGNGRLVNAPSISVSSVRINDICHQSQGVVTSGNGSFVNSTFISAPLRLKGDGDTSFDCQNDVYVSFPSISTPLRLTGREEASFECREIISDTECQGEWSF